MADTEMVMTKVLLDEVARTLKFVMKARSTPPPPPGANPEQWYPTPLEVITQPVNIQRGSATQPSAMTITYIEVNGQTVEHYWKYTWNPALNGGAGGWGVPVETNREGTPL